MQLTRCPHCHGRIDLHACVQDEAARDLIALMAKQPPGVGTALVQYLTLFRPAKRDLANTRALKLAHEALELSSDPYLLAAAMHETVEAIKAKRAEGSGQPLKSHGYLKSVLKSVAERANQPVREPAPQAEEEARQTRKRGHADDDEAWRRQMRKLGYDPDALVGKTGGTE